jgi:hypothetical protein
MAGQRTLQCTFRPIDKEHMQASVEREFATLERRLEQEKEMENEVIERPVGPLGSYYRTYLALFCWIFSHAT